MRKTTKNRWGKMLFAGMLSMVLVFGLVLPSCDDGNDDDNNNGSSGGSTYDGTYIYSEGNQKLILSGNNFTMSVSGGSIDYMKGTFTVSGTTVTYHITHMYDGSKIAPLPSPSTTTGTISSDGKTIDFGGAIYKRK
ncbi:MAG: hypothetical protein Ta2B_15090 [Termitinemataceae bacterium]|nr:MAG: hypothetical protein Ta2B_15090 [Termitinemataceae bacterium]